MENEKIQFNKKKIFILLLIIILISIMIFLILKRQHKNKFEKKKEEVIWKKPDGVESFISFYKNEETIKYLKPDDNNNLSNNYEFINEYKCTINECECLDVNYNKNYAIIKDSKYILYDIKKDEYKDLNIDLKYKNLSFLKYNNKVYGIQVLNNDKYAVYSIKEDRILTDFLFLNIDNDSPLFLNNYLSGSISVNGIVKYIIYDFYKNKNLKDSYYKIYGIGNDKYIYYYDKNEDNSYNIYNDSFSLFLDNKNKIYMFNVSKKGNIIILNDDNSFSIYNNSGKFVKSSKKYKKINYILKDYIIITDDDNYVKVINYDGNVVSKLFKMNDNIEINLINESYFNNSLCINVYVLNKDIENTENSNVIRYYFIPKSLKKGSINVTDF